MRVIGFSLTRGQAVLCTKFEMDLSEMNLESDNGYCPLIAFKRVSGRDKYFGFAFSQQQRSHSVVILIVLLKYMVNYFEKSSQELSAIHSLYKHRWSQ